MEGRGLVLGWWRGEEGFGVGGEVVAAVRAVEAFWQNDDVGARGRGFEHLISSMREILVLVGACQKVLSAGAKVEGIGEEQTAG